MQEDIKKCAEEVAEVLKKYNMTMQVQNGVAIVPLQTIPAPVETPEVVVEKEEEAETL